MSDTRLASLYIAAVGVLTFALAAFKWTYPGGRLEENQSGSAFAIVACFFMLLAIYIDHAHV